MDAVELQDRLSRAMGAAARVFGLPYDLFRARGADEPMRVERRVLRLPASFDGGDPGYRRPRGYERGLRGLFDADCTRVGDYLRGERGVLFIAALPLLARPLCVLTTTVVDVLRPTGALAPGLNGYGGVQEQRLRPVLRGWAAEVSNGSGGPRGAVANEGERSSWSVLLPVLPVPIQASDILQESGSHGGSQGGGHRRYVVRVAELSEYGWRLQVRQAEV